MYYFYSVFLLYALHYYTFCVLLLLVVVVIVFQYIFKIHFAE